MIQLICLLLKSFWLMKHRVKPMTSRSTKSHRRYLTRHRLLRCLWRAKSQHQLWSARDLLAKERFAFIFHLFQFFVSFKINLLKRNLRNLSDRTLLSHQSSVCNICATALSLSVTYVISRPNLTNAEKERNCWVVKTVALKVSNIDYIFYSIASINVSNPIKSSSKLYGL